MPRVLRPLSLLFVLSVLIPVLAHAQAPPQTPTGTPVLGSFGGGPDIINLANLNAHFTVPVLHKAGRGSDFNFYLTFDSSIWVPSGPSGSQTWEPVSNFGWDGSEIKVGNLREFSDTSTSICSPRPNEKFISNTRFSWRYIDGFGTSHEFGGSTRVTTNQCAGTTTQTSFTNVTALDGSGYTLSANGNSVTSLRGPDGRFIAAPLGLNTGAGSVQDRNGNKISTDSAGELTDTLGTVALTMTGTFAAPPIKITYTAPSGASASYNISFATHTVKTNFGCSGITEFPTTTKSLVDRITLPDATFYQFTYEATPGFSGDVTGRLASVTLPTGGTISYTYTGANNGIICADGSAAGLTRVTPDGTWTYTRAIGSGAASTTTVTAPKLPYDSATNQTQIQFQGIYETQRKVFQGSTSGTLLRTINTCYNGAAFPCTGTALTLPITQRVIQDQTGGSTGPICQHTFKYNNFGLPTEQDDTDYGSSTSPGALLRKELIAYASLGNNIVNQPSSITVEDGSGNVKAQTSFCYDEGTPSGTTTCAAAGAPTATSGTPQHVAVSGSRGNPTTIARLVSGSTTVGQKITYFDTGTVNTSTDINSAVTTFNYHDATSTCGNSFATSISEPLSLTRSIAWNCIGGVPSSVTDENGKTTTTSYTDPDFWRPSGITFPDGGQTSITYNSQTSTTLARKMNSSQNIVGITQLDGLSRVIHNQVCEDGTSSCTQPITTDTTYDSVGRVASVSNPHRASSSPTDGTTSTQYDALSRPTAVILQDGSSKSITSYSNNTVNSTDPAGKSRMSSYDGLGRTTQFFEDPSGFNYETDYSYDPLGNLLAVTQKGGSTSANFRNRTFTYDGLSRLTSESNPETGTITYKHDLDTNCASPNSSNGDLISRSDARNIRTCYQYDALHHLTQKNYSDNITPAANFNYNQSSALGVTLTNTLGRISSVSTAGTSPTGSVFSYDTVGRLIDNSQCTPQNCGTSVFTLQYPQYDLAGDLLSATNTAGITFSYAYDTAARLTTMTSNFVDGSHPGTLFSNAVYGPIGLTSDSLGNGITESLTYTNRQFLQSLTANSGTTTAYSFSVGTLFPNGNIQAANDSVNGNWTYTYDSLNRLATASESNTSQPCKGLQWGYDAWGNRTAQSVTAGTCGTFSATVDPNNRLSGSPYQYDVAGNLTNDGNHTYTYDAENRLTQVDGGSTASYVYDALGRRVRKTTSVGSVDYLYDLDGNQVAEVGSGGVFNRGELYLGTRHLATYTGGQNGATFFTHSDWLGTERARTDVTGAIAEACVNLPFGDSLSCSFTDLTPMHFTGDQRDTESNLDHTWFRQYSSQLGRWMHPDRLRGSLLNPQSLNRYTYVLNNPINLTDRLGLCPGGPNVRCRQGGPPPSGNCDSFDISGCGGGASGTGSDLGDGTFLSSDFGTPIFGNDIFDAINGQPGTFLSFNVYGQLSFGFSLNLYNAVANQGSIALTTSGWTYVTHDLGASTVTSGYLADLINAEQQNQTLTANLPAGANNDIYALFGVSNFAQGNSGQPVTLQQNLIDAVGTYLQQNGLDPSLQGPLAQNLWNLFQLSTSPANPLNRP